MEPGTFVFWQSTLGNYNDLDRVVLRDVLTKFNNLPDVIEESSQTHLVGEIVNNAMDLLTVKGRFWLTKSLEPTSWNGHQFVSVPVYLNLVKDYLNNV